MIQNAALLFMVSIALVSCGSDDDGTPTTPENYNLNFIFSHNWDGESVSLAEYTEKTYTNAAGTLMSIEFMRYLISGITLTNANGETTRLTDYQLIDLDDAGSFTLTTTQQIEEGAYTNISFNYGFEDTENFGPTYQDLNTANWNVPELLGGGYHYMQLNGKYANSNLDITNFMFHNIRAINMADGTTMDTHIVHNVGPVNVTGNTTINIKMDISEWFKSPNEWDLNTRFQMLMGNYGAQIDMNANGQDVFNVGSINIE